MDHRELPNVADAQSVQLDELHQENSLPVDQLVVQPQEGIEEHINKNRYGDIKTCPLYKELGGVVMNSIQEKVEQRVAAFEEKIEARPMISPALARARARREKARIAEVSNANQGEDSLQEIDDRSSESGISSLGTDYVVEAHYELQRQVDEARTIIDQAEIKTINYSPDPLQVVSEKLAPNTNPESAIPPPAVDQIKPFNAPVKKSLSQVIGVLSDDMATIESMQAQPEHSEVLSFEPSASLSLDTKPLDKIVPEISTGESPSYETTGAHMPYAIISAEREVVAQNAELSYAGQSPIELEIPYTQEVSFEYELVDDNGDINKEAVAERIAVFLQPTQEAGSVTEYVAESIIEHLRDVLTNDTDGIHTEELVDMVTRAVLKKLLANPSIEIDFDTLHAFIQQLAEELPAHLQQENLNILNLIGTNEHKFHTGWKGVTQKLTESTGQQRMSRFIMRNLLLSPA